MTTQTQAEINLEHKLLWLRMEVAKLRKENQILRRRLDRREKK